MITLSAQKREIFSSKLGSFRKKRLIPAELYGRGVENLHLFVTENDFQNTLKEAGETSVINVSIDDGGKHPVLIYNIHRHPVSDDILSIDFYQVKMDEAVQTYVPLELTNESSAVKDKDGILITVLKEVEVEALPAHIPKSIIVDISKLKNINDTITIGDLSALKDVKILAESNSVVAMVKAKMTEEEEKALEMKSGDVGAVEVVGEASDEEKAELAKEEAEETSD